MIAYPDFEGCDTNGGTAVTATLCLLRTVSAALTIPAGQSCISHDVSVENGVEVTIEDTGEWLIL